MKNGKYSQRKKSFWTGFIAALAAGAIATGLMLLLSLAIVGIVFGSLFVPFQHWLTARISRQNAAPGSADSLDEQEYSPGALSRRTLLRNGAIATGIVLVGVVAWRFITGAANSSNVS